jgi:hypothetical protein
VSRALGLRPVRVEAQSFSFPTLNTETNCRKMSNAESDRMPDGSAEDDDEPDEWCALSNSVAPMQC